VQAPLKAQPQILCVLCAFAVFLSSWAGFASAGLALGAIGSKSSKVTLRQVLAHLTVVGAALLLLLAVPRPSAAVARFGTDTAGSFDPAERALTGGVVTLRSPSPSSIRVAAGSFVMGSTGVEVVDAVTRCSKEPLAHRCNETLFSDEMPRHTVTLSSYWLDRSEVTVVEYQRCVALRRCRAAPHSAGARRFNRPMFPVSLVTWEDAQDFCRNRGGRLPTEAEFERAARGVERRTYPWGNLYNSRAANHGRLGWDTTDVSDGYAELAPVGSFPTGSTKDGFLDLAGNVAEWTLDRYLPAYSDAKVKDPRGPNAPPAGPERVVRGGHYSQAAPWLRGAARQRADPALRRPFLGFRCARSLAR
jgi:formylglycine-generating enzyme required for sulfatase activity